MSTKSGQALTPVAPTDRRRSLSPLHWVVGCLSLAMRSGSELSRVVGEMHHTWRDAPLPWDRQHQADLHRAPRPYLWIKLLLEHSANQIHRSLALLPAEHSLANQPMRRVRSALNGVVGDKLQEWRHPLALALELVDEHGHELQLAQLQRRFPGGVILCLHGLGLSESDWQSEAGRS